MIEFLLQKQNPDGGWPYRVGGSWTEPTVYATLALLSAGEKAAADRGIAWMLRTVREDGGWASRPEMESSWVTALAALLPEEKLGTRTRKRAIRWLLGVRGQDTMALEMLRLRLLGGKPSADAAHPGWPWTVGAAAWVNPTTVALLALEREQRMNPSPEVNERAEEGRIYLLSHMCSGGGWNYGSTSAWGFDMRAYPETTGMALAALRGVRAQQMEQAFAAALRFLETRSADAQNWLRLGLRAHGRLPDGYQPPADVRYRTVTEAALDSIASGGGFA